MEQHTQQLEPAQEICSKHTWYRTRSSEIFICSVCWAAGWRGEQTEQYTIPEQAQQLELGAEICSKHAWKRTRNPGIVVCSICWIAGIPPEQHTVPKPEFPGEQLLQQPLTPLPQNVLPYLLSHQEESDQEKQTGPQTDELKQGEQDSEEPHKRSSTKLSKKWTEVLTTLATWITILLTLSGLFWQVIQFNAQQSASAAQTLDQERQTTFDNYLDRMSDLLLTDHLQTVTQGSPVIAIAEARTMTALRDLDSFRRAELVRFLWKAGLVTGNSPVISLNAAPVSSTTFQHALLYDINFSKTLLISSTFNDCDLQNAIFSQAALPGATLNNVNLIGAIMTGANLYGATLEDVSLNGANLTDAALQKANLSGDDLTQVNLTGANLVGANLTDAILQGANLSGDDLTQVNLTGANLAGADLKGARITPAQFKQIASLQGTILPDGSQHP